MRAIITLPVLIALIVLSPPGGLTHDPAMVGLFVVTVAGAWLITFLIQATIGASALFLEKSMSLAELYFGLFSIFSGYIVPLELFPGWLQALTRWLPFRYQLSLSIELISGQLDLATALVEVGKQWVYVAGLWVLLAVVWRRGIERFQAFGG